jgi:SAM-dependent methyltransferase
MQPRLLEVLACPTCRQRLACSADETDATGDILSGTLTCGGCAAAFPISNGIPRFVPTANYALSFGYQWNRFRREQLDSLNGIRQSERRFHTETGWDAGWLASKWILDAGCGAGRFLDVASRASCDVVGVDISDAVDAARENLRDRSNVHLVQASLYGLPFRPGVFDGCYCIGVIQHTPDPLRAVRALPGVLRPEGRLAVTIYERRRHSLSNGKYLARRVTRGLDPRLLLACIRGVMPLAFPLTEILFRVPRLGRLFQFLIPVANYVRDPELTLRQRYQWAILDTFDMLSPRYDQPQREADVVAALTGEQIREIRRLPNQGLNVVGVRG